MFERVKIEIRGTVQGVGFRPFIYKIANELLLKGFVQNSTSGVTIECEGPRETLEVFIDRIRLEKPKISFISNFEYSFLEPIGYEDFKIVNSRKETEINAFILPDISTCPDCLKEMFDPKDRRYLYPFINCTNCGPRYSIIEELPYDRCNTTMKHFKMCKICEEEYNNPLDRRYHAQPIACPECGPHIELWDKHGNLVTKYYEAIIETASKVMEGNIVAIKGIGGFQLIADACDDDVVKNLRKRKHRIEKPFALMFPDLITLKEVCLVNPAEERLLLSNESPIVLLKRKPTEKSQPSNLVAPDNPYLGVMLPYSPLHHLLMKELKIPIIATSGNISEEPMCVDEYEALERLGNIADYFLVHNRPIARYVDDSIARVIQGKVMIVRRARGYAPFPLEIKNQPEDIKTKTVFAVGGYLKNTVAIKKGDNVFISQHIGDLSNEKSILAFQKTLEDFQQIYKSNSSFFVADAHPDYYSTQYAKSKSKHILTIQHHVAHAASCREENQVTGNALAVVWDGTGYGTDGTVWGGEFFICNEHSCIRIGHFRKFPLPGGEQAIREPRRSAFGMLWEIYGNSFSEVNIPFIKFFNKDEIKLIYKMLEQKINCPFTSSVGRIFDSVASILNLRQKINFEGQAAMMLEFISDSNTEDFYNFDIIKNEIFVIDWEPILESVVNDLNNGSPKSIIAAKFHNTLVEIILTISKLFAEERKVLLSGGCFQNSYLLEKTIKKLEKHNFKVFWHQKIPTNDGGISYGQIAALKWVDQDFFPTK